MKTNTPFPSKRKGKKFSVYAFDGKKVRLVHFGAKGYSDYTMHMDPDRKKRYIDRHKSNENWTKTGIFTAGFWSRWILWNKPHLKPSIAYTIDRFKLIVKKF